MLKENKYITRGILIILFICISLFSIFVVSKYASSPQTHASTIETLDNKKMTALELTAAVAATSTAISAIPGDTATPIANQLSELTTPLLFIVCAIYLEKFLLTSAGFITFTYFIPFACVLGALYLILQKQFLKNIAIKLTILGISLYLIVPLSVQVTNLIEATFENSIHQTFQTVDEIAEEAENSKEDNKGFLDFLTSIGDGVTDFIETAKNCLSIFVDAIAVLIITTCILPILVFIILFWLTKLLFNINFDIKKRKQMKTPKQIESAEN